MIYITGDTHGEYDHFLNRVYRDHVTEKDTVIVCGDFGFVNDLVKIKPHPAGCSPNTPISGGTTL